MIVDHIGLQQYVDDGKLLDAFKIIARERVEDCFDNEEGLDLDFQYLMLSRQDHWYIWDAIVEAVELDLLGEMFGVFSSEARTWMEDARALICEQREDLLPVTIKGYTKWHVPVDYPATMEELYDICEAAVRIYNSGLVEITRKY